MVFDVYTQRVLCTMIDGDSSVFFFDHNREKEKHRKQQRFIGYETENDLSFRNTTQQQP